MDTTLKDKIHKKDYLLVSIAKIGDRGMNLFHNKKGEEQFLVPEHIIHLIMAIAGIILLIYIVVKMAGYA